ncbi:MAG: hypothetical protein Ct9H90mP7_0070 [Candidatus Neomarinimicrobiota bacterium]|nr:MAG: hypothetical protein Ct9H90mP7_0070 [Candidatus Neomarinimicrobiota bacterium]
MIISNFSEGIMAGPSVFSKGIILPESQNHPLMDPSIFNALTEPCDLQYSITGTWALMIGFAVGLPPLWQIETGKSGVGIFGLMDQGSKMVGELYHHHQTLGHVFTQGGRVLKNIVSRKKFP